MIYHIMRRNYRQFNHYKLYSFFKVRIFGLKYRSKLHISNKKTLNLRYFSGICPQERHYCQISDDKINEERKKEALLRYNWNIQSEGIYDTKESELKNSMNRGYGLLAMSRWLGRRKASIDFNRTEELVKELFKSGTSKHNFYMNIINHGKFQVSNIDSPYQEKDKCDGLFYFFNNKGQLKKFSDRELGFADVKPSLSMIPQSS